MMESKSVFTFVIMSGAIMSTALWFYGKSQRTYPGHQQWTLGSFFLCFAFGGLMVRTVAPLWFAVGCANFFSALYGVAKLDAAVRFTGRGVLSRYWYLVGLANTSLAYYFLFVSDQISMRVFLTVAVASVFLSIASYVFIAKGPKGARVLYALVGAALASIPLAMLAMAAHWLVNPEINLFDGRWPRIPLFMVLAGSEVLASFFFVMVQTQRATAELEKAKDEIKTLKGIIPFCMYCHSIRDENGLWIKPDVYITNNSDAVPSHGICPDCLAEQYPELVKDYFPNLKK